jgi:hypothetical protein
MKKKNTEINYLDLQNKGRIVCELCGNPEKNLNFKGKKICEDCVKYVKNF